MNDPSRPSGSTWERINDRGRAFFRASWTEPGGPEGTLTIAETVADRYRIDDLFSAGELSVLLRAQDLRTSRPVLVKALRSDVVREPPPVPGLDPAGARTAMIRRARHSLQTERRLLVRLRNAGCNGVPVPHDYVYDRNPAWGEAPALDDSLGATEPYLVLQHVAGVSLEVLLRREFPRGMGELQALEVMAAVVPILERLHEPWRLPGGRTWHCVYQDLKPANLLIDPLGRPTLLDFGGCQVVVDGVPVLEGACTAGYAPPECLGPARVLLPCADVYGIGSTFYHMLTGDDPRDRFHRWRGAPGGHLDPRSLPAHLSPGIRRLLERCLAPRPSERLADARQVAQLLACLIAERRSDSPPRKLAPVP